MRHDTNIEARARARLVLDAIETARSALAALPATTERERLLERADACERAVRQWHAEPPNADAREKMMKSVLGLHVAATRLRLRLLR